MFSSTHYSVWTKLLEAKRFHQVGVLKLGLGLNAIPRDKWFPNPWICKYSMFKNEEHKGQFVKFENLTLTNSLHVGTWWWWSVILNKNHINNNNNLIFCLFFSQSTLLHSHRKNLNLHFLANCNRIFYTFWANFNSLCGNQKKKTHNWIIKCWNLSKYNLSQSTGFNLQILHVLLQNSP